MAQSHPTPTNRATIGALLAAAPIARDEAERLLAHVLRCDRATVFAHPQRPVPDDAAATFRALADRRAAGEPFAYLTATKEFYARPFRVTRDTLIPRPETEVLVDHALAHARAHIAATPQRGLIIVDVGTGSGAIIVTIAAELAATLPTHRCGFIGTDISAAALTIAHANAVTYDVAAQIAFLRADLLTPLLRTAVFRRVLAGDIALLICANLPYVDRAQRATLLAQPESRGLAFEPPEALWADDGGLALYQRFLTQIAALHAAHPHCPLTFLCEIDPAQTTIFQRRARAACGTALALTVHHDLSDRPRVIAGTLPPRYSSYARRTRATSSGKDSCKK